MRARPPSIAIPANATHARRLRLFARAPHEPLEARAVNGTTELRLYGAIGDGQDGITAEAFAGELKKVSGDLTLRVHSPGGDPLAAITMYNDLLNFPGKVRVEIPGLCASAATIPIMAADTIAIAENAHAMIHNVWTICIGDKHALRVEADVLNSIDKSLVITYAQRTGMAARDITAMLDKETWMGGADCVRLGFADEILKPSDAGARASFDLGVYQNVPAALAAHSPEANTKIVSRVDLERRLRTLGLSNGAAKKIAAEGWRGLAGDDNSEIENLIARIGKAGAELNTMRKN